MFKKRNSVVLSTIAILALSSTTYAGKIISDAVDPQNPTITENKQFGFGGWNYDNVDVRIVNVSDFGTAIAGSNFDTMTGIYTPMGADMSFEADIKNAMGTVMGHLHGKDWPVGEPSGIKVINGDTKTSHGKPENCIMTSSYLELQDMNDDTSGSGYLDVWPTEPNPVICSSPFQTHKRYKINLLPTTVETIDMDGYGKPVDLVFNLDPMDMNTTIRRYQVLQKANNYTGKRLDGYKVEVFDENGSKNAALTLSLGQGEGVDDNDIPDGSDLWIADEKANMSHGLWGPYQKSGGVVRFDNGFFDHVRAYYDVNLSDNNQTISYVGDMLGGNYQEIFGNWLPSIWEPEGIFHDDDQNPETDGVLKAFLGVAPGYTVRDWYKSVVTYDPDTPNIKPVYAWLPATDSDLAQWQGDWYEKGPIEDVLNLGLNYIINIGENAKIGSTFILRITPHVDTNQTPPSSYAKDPGEVKGTAHFDADTNADILWKNTHTNVVTLWYMAANGTYTDKEIDTVTSDMNIEGVGNFNIGGIADIIWRDTATNEIIIWNMAINGTYTQTNYGAVAPELNIEGIGDFNKDGIDDILWRNTSTGEISFWEIDDMGDKTESSLYFTGSTWYIKGVADLDGNGYDDILWRSNKNEIAITYIDAMFAYTDTTLYTTNRNWVIDSTGDIDANGADDIIWRNSRTHEIALTYMTKTKSIDSEVTLYTTSSIWSIESVADFDNNGNDDILWRSNPTTGTLSDVAITYMDGTPVKEEKIIETINK